MRILFLNQYFPPDPAPTGVLFAELAEALREEGAETEFISAGEGYRPSQGQGSRLRREAGALFHLLWQGVRARRADVVISGTSPPCLLLVATLVALRHRARSVHWLMDMYPELAVVLGEIPAGGIARLVAAAMGWCYRRAALVVALDEDMAARLRAYGVRAEIARPWVFRNLLPGLEALRQAPLAPKTPWTWIYSGNLGRAHEWETLLEAQRELEAADPEVRLVFQGGGPARAEAQARAAALGLQRCEWRPYVEEEQIASSLLECQAAVVTQLLVARGLLWPSKMGLLLALPRPIVWVGSLEGAVAARLRALPQAGLFAPGDASGLAAWLRQQKRSSPPAPAPAEDPAAVRQALLNQWRAWIRALAPAPR